MNLLEFAEKKLAGFAADPLTEFRRQSLARAQSAGWPTTHMESWKYTSVKSLRQMNFADQADPVASDLATIDGSSKLESLPSSFLVPGSELFVFVDGIFSETLSKFSSALHFQPWSQTLTPEFHRESLFEKDFFKNMTACLLTGGGRLRILPQQKIEMPIQFLFIQATAGSVAAPWIEIQAGNHSQFHLIESYFSMPDMGSEKPAVTLPHFQWVLSDFAKVDFSRLQNENSKSIHIGSCSVDLEAHTEFKSLIGQLGASLNRHDYVLNFRATESFAQVNGFYHGSAQQHVDHHTSIRHHIGHCTSTQLYKGLMKDASRAVFNGHVFINQDAQKASSEQLNQNLMLSRQAEVDSKPELEIYADDVKASHGSTIGQLNADELFYLTSRAIPKDTAVQMLSSGFLESLVFLLNAGPVQEWFLQHLRNKVQNA